MEIPGIADFDKPAGSSDLQTFAQFDRKAVLDAMDTSLLTKGSHRPNNKDLSPASSVGECEEVDSRSDHSTQSTPHTVRNSVRFNRTKQLKRLSITTGDVALTVW